MITKRFIKSFALALTASLFLISCGGNQNKNENNEETATIEAVSVEKALEQIPNALNQEISIEGLCTHICAHGGKKLFLVTDDGERSVQVIADESLGRFPEECVNAIVRVKGIVKENRIDEAKIQEMEAQMAKQTAEKHGEDESGCGHEQKANQEKPADTFKERMDNYRSQIAERAEKESKNYLSFYYIVASDYEIVE